MGLRSECHIFALHLTNFSDMGKCNFQIRSLFAGIFLFSLLFALPAVSVAQQIEVQSEEILLPAKRFSGIEVSGATEICEGSETALKVEGEYESYLWSTGEFGRTIKVQKAGVYEVTVKTKGGCTFTTSVNVRIKPCT
jgi:hypothetical protein